MATPILLSPLLEAELVGRLALSAALAGVLGWERQLGNQPAGLRTHMLVAVGAAAYTVAGTVGVAGHGTVQDAGRVAAQVVTGIGFVGAGTIWRSSGDARIIRGLTTAASIWVAGSLGMLCGFGMYILAGGCALLCFAILRLLRGLEHVPGALWSQIAAHRRRTVARSGAAGAAPVLPALSLPGAPSGDGLAAAEALPDTEPAAPVPGGRGFPTATRARSKRKGKKRQGRQTRADDQISDAGEETAAIAGQTAA